VTIDATPRAVAPCDLAKEYRDPQSRRIASRVHDLTKSTIVKINTFIALADYQRADELLALSFEQIEGVMRSAIASDCFV
jgi:hypothetical protein